MTKRSRMSLLKRAEQQKDAHAFGKPAVGVFVEGSVGAGKVRYSRLAGMLGPESRAALESDRRKAARCDVHGELLDPVLGVTTIGGEKRVAFGCPWCSGADVLAQWEREGAS